MSKRELDKKFARAAAAALKRAEFESQEAARQKALLLRRAKQELDEEAGEQNSDEL